MLFHVKFALVLIISYCKDVSAATGPEVTSNYTSLSDDAPESCRRKEVTADSSAKKIFLLTDPDVKQLFKVEDFDSNYCQKFPSWIKDVSDYKICMKPFQKSIFNMAIMSMKKTYKRFCLNNEAKELVFNHLRCLDPETKESFLGVGDRITTGLTYIADLKTVNDMIPALCCSISYVSQEGLKIATDACRNKTGPETGKFIVDITYSALADAVEIMCNGYSSPSECQAKVPVLMTDMKQVLDRPTRHDYSPLIPMLKFLNRMDKEINV